MGRLVAGLIPVDSLGDHGTTAPRRLPSGHGGHPSADLRGWGE